MLVLGLFWGPVFKIQDVQINFDRISKKSYHPETLLKLKSYFEERYLEKNLFFSSYNRQELKWPYSLVNKHVLKKQFPQTLVLDVSLLKPVFFTKNKKNEFISLSCNFVELSILNYKHVLPHIDSGSLASSPDGNVEFCEFLKKQQYFNISSVHWTRYEGWSVVDSVNQSKLVLGHSNFLSKIEDFVAYKNKFSFPNEKYSKSRIYDLRYQSKILIRLQNSKNKLNLKKLVRRED